MRVDSGFVSGPHERQRVGCEVDPMAVDGATAQCSECAMRQRASFFKRGVKSATKTVHLTSQRLSVQFQGGRSDASDRLTIRRIRATRGGVVFHLLTDMARAAVAEGRSKLPLVHVVKSPHSANHGSPRAVT
jgi:hypothetical protein